MLAFPSFSNLGCSKDSNRIDWVIVFPRAISFKTH